MLRLAFSGDGDERLAAVRQRFVALSAPHRGDNFLSGPEKPLDD